MEASVHLWIYIWIHCRSFKCKSLGKKLLGYSLLILTYVSVPNNNSAPERLVERVGVQMNLFLFLEEYLQTRSLFWESPPFGRSDHSIICHLLQYKALVKPVTKVIQGWRRDFLEDTSGTCMRRLKCTNKEIERSVSNGPFFANELSVYYSRFNCVDDSGECNRLCSSTSLTSHMVVLVFPNGSQRKASGPDGLKAHVLKDYGPQLKWVFTRFFQYLLNSHEVPKSWKLSIIEPVAKKPEARMLNEFQPQASLHPL